MDEVIEALLLPEASVQLADAALDAGERAGTDGRSKMEDGARVRGHPDDLIGEAP